jgi:hypothetical protein
MSNYILAQPSPQILAVSEQLIIGVVWCFVVLVITAIAVWKFRKVGEVMQLWAAMGTITGAMATYFFTREQLKEQKAQTEFFQAAYAASEKEKIDAGKHVWAVATKLQPDAALPQILQYRKYLEEVAGDLFSGEVRITRTETPSPPVRPTASPGDREFHDMLYKGSPKPTP